MMTMIGIDIIGAQTMLTVKTTRWKLKIGEARWRTLIWSMGEADRRAGGAKSPSCFFSNVPTLVTHMGGTRQQDLGNELQLFFCLPESSFAVFQP